MYKGIAKRTNQIGAGTYFINLLVTCGCIASMNKLLKNIIAINGFMLAILFGIAINLSKSFILPISTPNPGCICPARMITPIAAIIP